MAQRLRLTFPLNPVIWFLILLSLPLNIVIQIKFTKSRVYIFAVVEIGHQFLSFLLFSLMIQKYSTLDQSGCKTVYKKLETYPLYIIRNLNDYYNTNYEIKKI